MATVQKEVSDRTLFGKIMKWSFIIFNVIMLIWFIGGMSTAGDVVGNAASDAERAGAAIGTTLAAGMLLTLWAIGDVILGLFVLFTRRKKLITIEE
jgi:hypothetical protein